MQIGLFLTSFIESLACKQHFNVGAVSNGATACQTTILLQTIILVILYTFRWFR